MAPRPSARSRTARTALLGVWLAVIVVITTMPWSDFRSHAHWSKVNWIPFFGPYDELRDVILNVLAFVPLGLLLPVRTQRETIGLLAFALLLAAAAETYQVFTHSRIPSMTDIVAAGVGAWLGLGGTVFRARQRRRTTALIE